MWKPQIAALTQRFRVLRYDTRGHGQSSVTEGPYSIAQLGGDVIALLDHLGLQRVHFCGLSMGGITGMWLGVHHGDRLNKLILCNTAAYIGPPENWTNRAAAVERDGVASIAAAVVDKWLTPDFAAQQAELVQTLRAMLGATDRAATRRTAGPCGFGFAQRRAAHRHAHAGHCRHWRYPHAARRWSIPGGEHSRRQVRGTVRRASSNLQQVEGFNQAVLEFLGR